MSALGHLADRHPVLFVLALFLAESALALPFVGLFRALGLDLVPLRLLIPAFQSIFVLWLIGHLGWWRRAGLTGGVRAPPLLWYAALVAFAPVLFAGTIAVPAGWVAFYLAALLFTGISEEGMARGLFLPALISFGKWPAVIGAALLFSAGHISNAFFESFDALAWVDKFLATFAFGVLYGALFLRTGSLLPLILLHVIHDFSYLVSGTAGPFTVAPLAPGLHIALSLANLVVGIFLLAGATRADAAERAGG